MSKYCEYIKDNYNFEELRDIVKILRAPDGCPWDRAQTHESMENCMLEESAEVISAVRNKDMQNLCEELGDVMLQVLLHTSIAEENGEFTFEDVVNELASKLVRRHPNVFISDEREQEIINPEEGLKRWETVKIMEKKLKGQDDSHELSRIPSSLPPVYRTRKVLKKAAKIYGEDKIPENTVSELNILMEKCLEADKSLTKCLETFINDME